MVDKYNPFLFLEPTSVVVKFPRENLVVKKPFKLVWGEKVSAGTLARSPPNVTAVKDGCRTCSAR